MNDNVEFPAGLFAKAPRAGSPDFVKGSISIKREELMGWLASKEGEWINLDIKVSKNDKYYAQVNTWKPNFKRDGYSEDVAPEFKDSDVPF